MYSCAATRARNKLNKALGTIAYDNKQHFLGRDSALHELVNTDPEYKEALKRVLKKGRKNWENRKDDWVQGQLSSARYGSRYGGLDNADRTMNRHYFIDRLKKKLKEQGKSEDEIWKRVDKLMPLY